MAPRIPRRPAAGRDSRIGWKSVLPPLFRRHRTFSVAFALYLALATVVAGTAARILHGRSTPTALGALALNSQGATAKYLVLIVLDGARPDYFGLTPLPHVDALRNSGTQFTQAMDGILEAETPAGHATIATGSRPDRTGILGFDWANDSGRTSLFSPDQMGNLEQMLNSSGASTIAGLYKARFPGARVVALSGHKYYAAAPLGGPAADAIMYYQGDPKGRYVPVAVPGHIPPSGVLDAPGLIYPSIHLANGVEDHLATRLALASVATMHPRLLLINYPEFDWPLGHVDGGSLDKGTVVTDMQGFDTDLGAIENAYRREGILNQTLFVVTADHGMMPISRFVPSSVVTNAVAQAGTTAPDIATNSGDYVWLADPTRAQTVADNIVKAQDPGIQSVYYLSTLGGQPHYVAADGVSLSPADEAANQYLLGALMNGHEPTVVAFGTEGTSFSDPSSNWKADHGGNSWQSQHIPLILAGPGIRSGQVSNAPVQLDDVAPTVLADMGVTPRGMEGHIVTEALTRSTAADQQARAAEARIISPVITSLSNQDQSALEASQP